MEDNISIPLISIYVMGKKYEVPESLTIMDALEYAGYQLKRGCGCRAGFCGACATVFRIGGQSDLQVGLACQTKVEPEMYLAQIPFFPARKARYNLDELRPVTSELNTLYPELFRCLGCNSCTKVCPQDINVMQYIAALQRGDFQTAADLSFDCLMCGLCVSRCPVNIVHYNAGILARRIYGKHMAKPDPNLKKRIEEIEEKVFDVPVRELMKAGLDELKDRYNNRDIES